MNAAIVVPGKSRTILTHVFRCGHKDDRYAVERFQAIPDGDIETTYRSVYVMTPLNR